MNNANHIIIILLTAIYLKMQTKAKILTKYKSFIRLYRIYDGYKRIDFLKARSWYQLHLGCRDIDLDMTFSINIPQCNCRCGKK